MIKHTIDATGKKLGRVATEAAAVLLGKTSVDFAKNKVADVLVEIKNASKISLDENKDKDTLYTTYSGYPGGLYHQSMRQIRTEKGFKELFELAIYGMLPKNSLNKERMKRLIVTE